MIPDVWYPILEARKLRRKPLGIKRLGRDLVVWRGPDGKPVAAPLHCPHRGAAFSQGCVRDGRLVCPMHGFEFDAEGHCTLMPWEGTEGRIRKGLDLQLFAVREAHGLIWFWNGEPQASLPEVPWFDDVATPIERSAQISYPLPYHYTRLVEMILDMYHLPFVHKSALPGLGKRLDGYESHLAGDRIYQSGRLCKPTGETTFTFRCDGMLPCLSMVEAHPKMRCVIAVTPIDEKTTWMWYRYFQDFTNLPGLRHFMAWVMLMFEWQIVQRQDWRIFDGMAPGTIDDVPFHFVKADTAIGLYRKVRRDRLRAASAREGADAELRVLQPEQVGPGLAREEA